MKQTIYIFLSTLILSVCSFFLPAQPATAQISNSAIAYGISNAAEDEKNDSSEGDSAWQWFTMAIILGGMLMILAKIINMAMQ